MDLQAQMERVRSQQVIDALSNEDRRTVLRESTYVFRKYLSPINGAKELARNYPKMKTLCRLDKDVEADVELAVARLAAQISDHMAPHPLARTLQAAGIDITAVARMRLEDRIQYGKIAATTTGNNDEDATYDYKGWRIVLKAARVPGHTETNDYVELLEAMTAQAERQSGSASTIKVKYEAAEKYEGEIFDTIHDPWRPTTVYSPRLKKHPNDIIEPSTLAATPFPAPTYEPVLPAVAIDRGFISDAQFETIVYGLQAVTNYLPGSPSGPFGPKVKGGFIIGDGTGVGKTNEYTGMIMDQWIRGVKRHIIVAERASHIDHIREGWQMIGGDSKIIMAAGDYSANESLPMRDGIMLTTYALIREERRYQQLLDWANDRQPMNGILVFDEAQNMRNAVEDEFNENTGRHNQSQQGQRGVELQEDLPHAGVVYASATMATDVYNLGYASRLGLWGENAPFVNSREFINEMYALEDAALEQICIDLKAAGRYTSRTLSFEGVEYQTIEHRLTPAQRNRFNETVTAWRKFEAMNDVAWEKIGFWKPRAAYRDNKLDRNLRLRIEKLLTRFNVETMIEDMHEEIARGNAPVIQVERTGAAEFERRYGDQEYVKREEYRDNSLEDWIHSSYPISNYVPATPDEPGAILLNQRGPTNKANGYYKPERDKDGNIIVNPDLLKMREEALAIASTIGETANALDRIYEEFGANAIAEMTGRTLRPIPRRKNGEIIGWDIEKRSNKDASADVERFQEGKKDILIFSLGAGGTGKSYHASQNHGNQRRRVHYLLEIGRRSEAAVQGIGRTHRSGQTSAPIVKAVTSDIPAYIIYTSKTLAKIAKMGALSRGHQHAASNAIFEQRVPLNSRYAKDGWKQVIQDISQGRLGDLTIRDLSKQLRMKETNVVNYEEAIMRLAQMVDEDQRLIVDALISSTEEAITTAIRNGTFNQGMETIRADSIEVVDRNTIKNVNGTTTTYTRLRRRDTIEQIPFRRAAMTMAGVRARKGDKAVFMQHKVSGRIMLATLRSGARFIDVITPSGTASRTLQAIENEPWKVLPNIEEAQRIWDREMETQNMQAETDLHILSGSLLYNWDKLPKTGIGLNRCKTDDGEIIVGRVISPGELRTTLKGMGMRSTQSAAELTRMLLSVDRGAAIKIDNGWRIEQPDQPGGDYNLIIPDNEQTGPVRRDLAAIGVKVRNTPLGTDFTIERSKSLDIIRGILIGNEITLEGNTLNMTAVVPDNDDEDDQSQQAAAC